MLLLDMIKMDLKSYSILVPVSEVSTVYRAVCIAHGTDHAQNICIEQYHDSNIGHKLVP